MTSTAEFSALLEKKANLEEQIKAEAKEVFSNSAKEIFEQYGDQVATFGWQQYTPYFNDGDPCEFSKGEIFIYSPQEIEDEDKDISYWESEGIFGYRGNSKTLHKHKETGETTDYIPYNREARETPTHLYESVPNPDYDPDLDKAKDAVIKLCNLIDEDTALALFGDHTTVIVKPTGVETDDCEHE